MISVLGVIFVWTCMHCPAQNCMASDDPIIASGDGFELTESDVNRFREYFDKTSIRTTPAEYRKGALKIKLFAHEAAALNLDKGWDPPAVDRNAIEYWMKLSEAYIKQVMESYPVSDLAIESYYRAFPERFETKTESSAGSMKGVPDLEDQKKIRIAIVNAQKKHILSGAEAKLIEKYHVKMLEEKGDG
jgi:hypothetical protein